MIGELREKLVSSRAERLKFFGNAVEILESQGIVVTDEVIKQSIFNADEDQLVKALTNPVAGILLL